jgi:hypothetical protein
MMIGPSVFLIAEGAQRIRAKTLAYEIIKRLRDQGDDHSSIVVEDEALDGDDQPNPVSVSHERTATLPGSNKPGKKTKGEAIESLDSVSKGISFRDEEDDTRSSVEHDDTENDMQESYIEVQRPRGGGPTPASKTTPPRDVDGNDNDNDSGNDPTGDTEHIEHLLAWLSACEKKLVPAAKVSDPIYDTLLVSAPQGHPIKAQSFPQAINNGSWN